MGYNTQYELTVKGSDGNIDFEKIIGNTYYGGYSPFSDATKWYNHEKDMINLSNKYPGILFIVEGYGEDRDDIWRKYFKDGNIQKSVGKVIFEDCAI